MFHQGEKTDIELWWVHVSNQLNVEEKDLDEKNERHELETVKRLKTSRWQKRHMVELETHNKMCRELK